MALENHVFSSFRPYSAFKRPSAEKIGAESLTSGQIFRLRLEIRLIGIICT